MPGQRRLHFCTERDSRRHEIISVITSLKPQVLLYDAANHRSVKTARRACLEAIVDDLTALPAERLIIERDSTTLEADRRWLFEKVRQTEHGSLTYVHQRAHEEALLAIPDAVAWSWGSPWTLAATDRHLGVQYPAGLTKKREARLAHRPEGCRAHFAGLLPLASTIMPQ